MKRFSEGTKLTIQIILSVILIFAGLTLLFFGFFTPPQGDISNSVLVAYGEVSTFAWALIGVDYSYKFRTYKLDSDIEIEERKRKYKEEENNGDIDG